MRPSLTAAARDGRTIVRVGTEEWLRRGPNQRMARHRRATCRQIRSPNPKLSPLHGTGVSLTCAPFETLCRADSLLTCRHMTSFLFLAQRQFATLLCSLGVTHLVRSDGAA